MHYEVEQKFPVADLAPIAAALEALGAEISPPVQETDYYYGHPARDFSTTDEALRIREVSGRYYITYKGPKIDQQTKTRREIELPLAAEADLLDKWQSLLEALGFNLVGKVQKQRRRARLVWEDRPVQVTLDQVPPLGCFVELETTAREDQLDAARASIASLAARLGLAGGERRSYLELLLEREGG